MQSGACISSKKSILPTLAVWYVVSYLNFFKIVEVQQWIANRVRNGLGRGPAAGASSVVSTVKDLRFSESVFANNKCIIA